MRISEEVGDAQVAMMLRTRVMDSTEVMNGVSWLVLRSASVLNVNSM